MRNPQEWPLLYVVWLLLPFTALSQKAVQIRLVADYPPVQDSISLDLSSGIQEEITALLGTEYQFTFEQIYCDFTIDSVASALDMAYADPEVDVVIAVGILASQLMSQRPAHSKPAQAVIVIDTTLQNTPITAAGTSGIDNFTYIISPFDINQNLEALYRLRPFEKLGVFGDNRLLDNVPFLQTQLGGIVENLGVTTQDLQYTSDPESMAEQISSDIDAILLLPRFGQPEEQNLSRLLDILNERGIPSLTLFGEPFLNLGATIGYAANDNLKRVPRRAATNLYKILKGQNPSDLAVEIETYSEKLMINMASVRKAKVFPSFDLMADAQLLNMAELPAERTLNLQAAVVEALQTNLELRAAQVNPVLAQNQVRQAGSDLLPQLDVSSTFARINEAQAQSSFGAQGLYNWSAAGSLSQVIVSEPAFANVAIQRLLQESAQYEFETVQLDVMLEVSEAFLQLLQAKAALEIQNQNLEVSRENLSIARAKEELGYSGQSDVLRLRSELAQRNVDLNEARANFTNARFRVNQLLNRPLDELFAAEDVVNDSLGLDLVDSRLDIAINNFQRLDQVSDLLVAEALRNLPELRQIDAGLAAQDRTIRFRDRNRYLPSIALSGNYSYLLGRYNVPEITGVPPELLQNFSGDANRTQWNLGLGLQYPIFQGNRRNYQLEQSRLEKIQIEAQRADLVNLLSLQVRTAVQNVGVSSSRVELSQESAVAARENFELVQDLYSEGGVNITSLLDAQNASVQAELLANNAVYQFVTDVLRLERAIGNFYTFDDAGAREAFFQQLITQLLNAE